MFLWLMKIILASDISNDLGDWIVWINNFSFWHGKYTFPFWRKINAIYSFVMDARTVGTVCLRCWLRAFRLATIPWVIFACENFVSKIRSCYDVANNFWPGFDREWNLDISGTGIWKNPAAIQCMQDYLVTGRWNDVSWWHLVAWKEAFLTFSDFQRRSQVYVESQVYSRDWHNCN